MADLILEVGGDLRPLEKEIRRVSRKGINPLNERGFTQPLGRITGQIGEFEKSLEASNARVLAFGASAGALVAVQQAFQAILKSTINVETKLADMNVILNISSKNLEKFSGSLFGVARSTASSFDDVAEAATELARQGLSVEQTLKRTQDALILTRLSGLAAADSVEAITAALNSFSRAALDSSTFVSKLAAVDAAFAVSSKDLAEAVKRVGSSAIEAGLGIDELIAAVTSAQQITARGGAVIGNSFKTIFTRIQRPKVIEELENLGIAVKGIGGSVKPAMQILQELANTYDNLSSTQKAATAELIGGVFQVNVLKASLRDLSKEYSLYKNALDISGKATDEAARRNEELNKTVGAQLSQTVANLTNFGSKLGQLTFAPAMKKVLGGINSAIQDFDLKNPDTVGEKIGAGVLGGIGKFLQGPGLLVIGVTLIKTFSRLARQVTDAFKTMSNVGKASTMQLAAQQKVSAVLSAEPQILAKIQDGTMDVADAHRKILYLIEKETEAQKEYLSVVSRVAAVAGGPGMFAAGPRSTTFSQGHIPNFNKDKDSKRKELASASYSKSSTRAVKDKMPGVGTYYRNTAEKKIPGKQFGLKQDFIVPPKGSPEGSTYRKQTSKMGIDVDRLAYSGHVPNFKTDEAASPVKLPIKLTGRAKAASDSSALVQAVLERMPKSVLTPDAGPEGNWSKGHEPMTIAGIPKSPAEGGTSRNKGEDFRRGEEKLITLQPDVAKKFNAKVKEHYRNSLERVAVDTFGNIVPSTQFDLDDVGFPQVKGRMFEDIIQGLGGDQNAANSGVDLAKGLARIRDKQQPGFIDQHFSGATDELINAPIEIRGSRVAAKDAKLSLKAVTDTLSEQGVDFPMHPNKHFNAMNYVARQVAAGEPIDLNHVSTIKEKAETTSPATITQGHLANLKYAGHIPNFKELFSRSYSDKVHEDVKDAFYSVPHGDSKRPSGVMMDYFNMPNKKWHEGKDLHVDDIADAGVGWPWADKIKGEMRNDFSRPKSSSWQLNDHALQYFGAGSGKPADKKKYLELFFGKLTHRTAEMPTDPEIESQKRGKAKRAGNLSTEDAAKLAALPPSMAKVVAKSFSGGEEDIEHLKPGGMLLRGKNLAEGHVPNFKDLFQMRQLKHNPNAGNASVENVGKYLPWWYENPAALIERNFSADLGSSNTTMDLWSKGGSFAEKGYKKVKPKQTDAQNPARVTIPDGENEGTYQVGNTGKQQLHGPEVRRLPADRSGVRKFHPSIKERADLIRGGGGASAYGGFEVLRKVSEFEEGRVQARAMGLEGVRDMGEMLAGAELTEGEFMSERGGTGYRPAPAKYTPQNLKDALLSDDDSPEWHGDIAAWLLGHVERQRNIVAKHHKDNNLPLPSNFPEKAHGPNLGSFFLQMAKMGAQFGGELHMDPTSDLSWLYEDFVALGRGYQSHMESSFLPKKGVKKTDPRYLAEDHYDKEGNIHHAASAMLAMDRTGEESMRGRLIQKLDLVRERAGLEGLVMPTGQESLQAFERMDEKERKKLPTFKEAEQATLEFLHMFEKRDELQGFRVYSDKLDDARPRDEHKDVIYSQQSGGMTMGNPFAHIFNSQITKFSVKDGAWNKALKKKEGVGSGLEGIGDGLWRFGEGDRVEVGLGERMSGYGNQRVVGPLGEYEERYKQSMEGENSDRTRALNIPPEMLHKIPVNHKEQVPASVNPRGGHGSYEKAFKRTLPEIYAIEKWPGTVEGVGTNKLKVHPLGTYAEVGGGKAGLPHLAFPDKYSEWLEDTTRNGAGIWKWEAERTALSANREYAGKDSDQHNPGQGSVFHHDEARNPSRNRFFDIFGNTKNYKISNVTAESIMGNLDADFDAKVKKLKAQELKILKEEANKERGVLEAEAPVEPEETGLIARAKNFFSKKKEVAPPKPRRTVNPDTGKPFGANDFEPGLTRRAQGEAMQDMFAGGFVPSFGKPKFLQQTGKKKGDGSGLVGEDEFTIETMDQEGELAGSLDFMDAKDEMLINYNESYQRGAGFAGFQELVRIAKAKGKSIYSDSITRQLSGENADEILEKYKTNWGALTSKGAFPQLRHRLLDGITTSGGYSHENVFDNDEMNLNFKSLKELRQSINGEPRESYSKLLDNEQKGMQVLINSLMTSPVTGTGDGSVPNFTRADEMGDTWSIPATLTKDLGSQYWAVKDRTDFGDTFDKVKMTTDVDVMDVGNAELNEMRDAMISSLSNAVQSAPSDENEFAEWIRDYGVGEVQQSIGSFVNTPFPDVDVADWQQEAQDLLANIRTAEASPKEQWKVFAGSKGLVGEFKTFQSNLNRGYELDPTGKWASFDFKNNGVSIETRAVKSLNGREMLRKALIQHVTDDGADYKDGEPSTEGSSVIDLDDFGSYELSVPPDTDLTSKGHIPNYLSAKGRETPLYDLDGTIIKEGFFDWNDPDKVSEISTSDLTNLGQRLAQSKELVDIATARDRKNAASIKPALSGVGINVGKVMPLSSMFTSQKKKGVRKPLVNLTGPDKKRLIADKLGRDLIDNDQKNIDALGPRGIHYQGQAGGYIPNYLTGLYDSDRLPEGVKRNPIIDAIIAEANAGKKMHVFHGPAGAGKTSAAMARYPSAELLKDLNQVPQMDDYAVVSGTNRSKKSGEYSARAQNILNSASKITAVIPSHEDLTKRRLARVEEGSVGDDKRSKEQLKTSLNAPGPDYRLYSDLKKSGANLEILRGGGHIPNFSAEGDKISDLILGGNFSTAKNLLESLDGTKMRRKGVLNKEVFDKLLKEGPAPLTAGSEDVKLALDFLRPLTPLNAAIRKRGGKSEGLIPNFSAEGDKISDLILGGNFSTAKNLLESLDGTEMRSKGVLNKEVFDKLLKEWRENRAPRGSEDIKLALDFLSPLTPLNADIRKRGGKSEGLIPSFLKYQIGQKLPKGRGAGGRHLAVRDQNMGIHYDPTAAFHADLVKKSNLMGKTMDGGWLHPNGEYEKIQGHDGSGLQSQGLIPNFALLSTSKKDWKSGRGWTNPDGTASAGGEVRTSAGALNYDETGDSLDIKYNKSDKRGGGFSQFKGLVEEAERKGKSIVSGNLINQKARMDSDRPMLSKLKPFEQLAKHAYPQLRHRMLEGVKTSGSSSWYLGDFLGQLPEDDPQHGKWKRKPANPKFKSLKELKSKANKENPAEFADAIIDNQINVDTLTTTTGNKAGLLSRVVGRKGDDSGLLSGGLIPNFLTNVIRGGSMKNQTGRAGQGLGRGDRKLLSKINTFEDLEAMLAGNMGNNRMGFMSTTRDTEAGRSLVDNFSKGTNDSPMRGQGSLYKKTVEGGSGVFGFDIKNVMTKAKLKRFKSKAMVKYGFDDAQAEEYVIQKVFKIAGMEKSGKMSKYFGKGSQGKAVGFDYSNWYGKNSSVGFTGFGDEDRAGEVGVAMFGHEKRASNALSQRRRRSGGFAPNFANPLSDAINREASAVPKSTVRVGQSPKLMSSGNPAGLGVYNTLHEPRGLNQGIQRARSEKRNPKTYGAAKGFLPNFAAEGVTLDVGKEVGLDSIGEEARNELIDAINEVRHSYQIEAEGSDKLTQEKLDLAKKSGVTGSKLKLYEAALNKSAKAGEEFAAEQKSNTGRLKSAAKAVSKSFTESTDGGRFEGRLLALSIAVPQVTEIVKNFGGEANKTFNAFTDSISGGVSMFTGITSMFPGPSGMAVAGIVGIGGAASSLAKSLQNDSKQLAKASEVTKEKFTVLQNSLTGYAQTFSEYDQAAADPNSTGEVLLNLQNKLNDFMNTIPAEFALEIGSVTSSADLESKIAEIIKKQSQVQMQAEIGVSIQTGIDEVEGVLTGLVDLFGRQSRNMKQIFQGSTGELKLERLVNDMRKGVDFRGLARDTGDAAAMTRLESMATSDFISILGSQYDATAQLQLVMRDLSNNDMKKFQEAILESARAAERQAEATKNIETFKETTADDLGMADIRDSIELFKTNLAQEVVAMGKLGGGFEGFMDPKAIVGPINDALRDALSALTLAPQGAQGGMQRARGAMGVMQSQMDFGTFMPQLQTGGGTGTGKFDMDTQAFFDEYDSAAEIQFQAMMTKRIQMMQSERATLVTQGKSTSIVDTAIQRASKTSGRAGTMQERTEASSFRKRARKKQFEDKIGLSEVKPSQFRIGLSSQTPGQQGDLGQALSGKGIDGTRQRALVVKQYGNKIEREMEEYDEAIANARGNVAPGEDPNTNEDVLNLERRKGELATFQSDFQNRTTGGLQMSMQELREGGEKGINAYDPQAEGGQFMAGIKQAVSVTGDDETTGERNLRVQMEALEATEKLLTDAVKAHTTVITDRLAEETYRESTNKQQGISGVRGTLEAQAAAGESVWGDNLGDVSFGGERAAMLREMYDQTGRSDVFGGATGEAGDAAREVSSWLPYVGTRIEQGRAVEDAGSSEAQQRFSEFAAIMPEIKRQNISDAGEVGAMNKGKRSLVIDTAIKNFNKKIDEFNLANPSDQKKKITNISDTKRFAMAAFETAGSEKGGAVAKNIDDLLKLSAQGMRENKVYAASSDNFLSTVAGWDNPGKAAVAIHTEKIGLIAGLRKQGKITKEEFDKLMVPLNKQAKILKEMKYDFKSKSRQMGTVAQEQAFKEADGRYTGLESKLNLGSKLDTGFGNETKDILLGAGIVGGIGGGAVGGKKVAGAINRGSFDPTKATRNTMMGLSHKGGFGFGGGGIDIPFGGKGRGVFGRQVNNVEEGKRVAQGVLNSSKKVTVSDDTTAFIKKLLKEAEEGNKVAEETLRKIGQQSKSGIFGGTIGEAAATHNRTVIQSEMTNTTRAASTSAAADAVEEGVEAAGRSSTAGATTTTSGAEGGSPRSNRGAHRFGVTDENPHGTQPRRRMAGHTLDGTPKPGTPATPATPAADSSRMPPRPKGDAPVMPPRPQGPAVSTAQRARESAQRSLRNYGNVGAAQFRGASGALGNTGGMRNAATTFGSRVKTAGVMNYMDDVMYQPGINNLTGSGMGFDEFGARKGLAQGVLGINPEHFEGIEKGPVKVGEKFNKGRAATQAGQVTRAGVDLASQTGKYGLNVTNQLMGGAGSDAARMAATRKASKMFTNSDEALRLLSEGKTMQQLVDGGQVLSKGGTQTIASLGGDGAKSLDVVQQSMTGKRALDAANAASKVSHTQGLSGFINRAGAGLGLGEDAGRLTRGVNKFGGVLGRTMNVAGPGLGVMSGVASVIDPDEKRRGVGAGGQFLRGMTGGQDAGSAIARNYFGAEEGGTADVVGGYATRMGLGALEGAGLGMGGGFIGAGVGAVGGAIVGGVVETMSKMDVDNIAFDELSASIDRAAQMGGLFAMAQGESAEVLMRNAASLQGLDKPTEKMKKSLENYQTQLLQTNVMEDIGGAKTVLEASQQKDWMGHSNVGTKERGVADKTIQNSLRTAMFNAIEGIAGKLDLGEELSDTEKSLRDRFSISAADNDLREGETEVERQNRVAISAGNYSADIAGSVSRQAQGDRFAYINKNYEKEDARNLETASMLIGQQRGAKAAAEEKMLDDFGFGGKLKGRGSAKSILSREGQVDSEKGRLAMGAMWNANAAAGSTPGEHKLFLKQQERERVRQGLLSKAAGATGVPGGMESDVKAFASQGTSVDQIARLQAAREGIRRAQKSGEDWRVGQNLFKEASVREEVSAEQKAGIGKRLVSSGLASVGGKGEEFAEADKYNEQRGKALNDLSAMATEFQAMVQARGTDEQEGEFAAFLKKKDEGAFGLGRKAKGMFGGDGRGIMERAGLDGTGALSEFGYSTATRDAVAQARLSPEFYGTDKSRAMYATSKAGDEAYAQAATGAGISTEQEILAAKQRVAGSSDSRSLDTMKTTLEMAQRNVDWGKSADAKSFGLNATFGQKTDASGKILGGADGEAGELKSPEEMRALYIAKMEKRRDAAQTNLSGAQGRLSAEGTRIAGMESQFGIRKQYGTEVAARAHSIKSNYGNQRQLLDQMGGIGSEEGLTKKRESLLAQAAKLESEMQGENLTKEEKLSKTRQISNLQGRADALGPVDSSLEGGRKSHAERKRREAIASENQRALQGADYDNPDSAGSQYMAGIKKNNQLMQGQRISLAANNGGRGLSAFDQAKAAQQKRQDIQYNPNILGKGARNAVGAAVNAVGGADEFKNFEKRRQMLTEYDRRRREGKSLNMSPQVAKQMGQVQSQKMQEFQADPKFNEAIRLAIVEGMKQGQKEVAAKAGADAGAEAGAAQTVADTSVTRRDPGTGSGGPTIDREQAASNMESATRTDVNVSVAEVKVTHGGSIGAPLVGREKALIEELGNAIIIAKGDGDKLAAELNKKIGAPRTA